MITPIENAADLAENKQDINYGTLEGEGILTNFRFFTIFFELFFRWLNYDIFSCK